MNDLHEATLQWLNDLTAQGILTTDAELRQRLLPRAPRIDPAELMELGEAYARTIDYPIQYQWTLLKGINDSQEEMVNILRLFKGKFAVLNLMGQRRIRHPEQLAVVRTAFTDASLQPFDPFRDTPVRDVHWTFDDANVRRGTASESLATTMGRAVSVSLGLRF